MYITVHSLTTYDIQATEIATWNQDVTDKMAVLWDAVEATQDQAALDAMADLCTKLSAMRTRLNVPATAPTSGGTNKP